MYPNAASFKNFFIQIYIYIIAIWWNFLNNSFRGQCAPQIFPYNKIHEQFDNKKLGWTELNIPFGTFYTLHFMGKVPKSGPSIFSLGSVQIYVRCDFKNNFYNKRAKPIHRSLIYMARESQTKTRQV